jgi:hypothetical protein
MHVVGIGNLLFSPICMLFSPFTLWILFSPSVLIRAHWRIHRR